MNRDEARQLIGGYATNSLTDEERRVLFEAALEDQELFDALQDEQALKALLDDPFSREQVRRAASEKPREAWFKRPWIWAVSGIAVAGLATFAVLLRPPSPQPMNEVAQAVKPAPVVAPPQSATTPAPSVPTPAPPVPKIISPRGQLAAEKTKPSDALAVKDTASAPVADEKRREEQAEPVREPKQKEARDQEVTADKKASPAPAPPPQNVEARNQVGGPLQNTNQQQAQQVIVQAGKVEAPVTGATEPATAVNQFRAGTNAPKVSPGVAGSSFALMKAGLSPQVQLAKKSPNGLFLDAPLSTEFKPGDVVQLTVVSPFGGQLAVEVKENETAPWTRLFPLGDSRVALSPDQRYTVPATITIKEDQRVQVVISRPRVGPVTIPVPLKVAQ